MKCEFMEWVESSRKGRVTLALLQEFERRFMWLSVLDRTMLDTSKVLIFIRTVDPLHWEKMGLLLETNEGLMTHWALVERVCSHFDKQQEWKDQGSSMTGPRTWRKPILARMEETRRWLE